MTRRADRIIGRGAKVVMKNIYYNLRGKFSRLYDWAKPNTSSPIVKDLVFPRLDRILKDWAIPWSISLSFVLVIFPVPPMLRFFSGAGREGDLGIDLGTLSQGTLTLSSIMVAVSFPFLIMSMTALDRRLISVMKEAKVDDADIKNSRNALTEISFDAGWTSLSALFCIFISLVTLLFSGMLGKATTVFSAATAMAFVLMMVAIYCSVQLFHSILAGMGIAKILYNMENGRQ